MCNCVEISVVLPVYNVIDYLDECIKSVLKQTFIDFELIIVDDGSNDGSQIKCDEYGALDGRIIVLHQKNGGLSAARNSGIKSAKGKYVTFIDSDDFVSEYYLELLHAALTESGADISMCDYKEVTQLATMDDLKLSNIKKDSVLLYSGKEIIKEVYSNNYHGIEFVSWAKMYRLDLFKDNNILFPIGKLHEDAFTTYKLFYSSVNVAYIDNSLYFYRIRSGSIMTSKFSEKRLDMIEATREEFMFFKDNEDYELMTLAFYDHLHKVKLLLKMLFNSSDYDKNIVKKVCNTMDSDIKECKKCISIPFVKYAYYKGMTKFPKFFVRIR